MMDMGPPIIHAAALVAMAVSRHIDWQSWAATVPVAVFGQTQTFLVDTGCASRHRRRLPVPKLQRDVRLSGRKAVPEAAGLARGRPRTSPV